MELINKTYKALCPAKINLFLHITGKKEDGYHLLDSLFVFTDIKDEMYFKLSDNFSLKVEGKFKDNVPVDESNIVLKAANLLKKHSGNEKLGIDIELIKNIPNGAGLGGGSSNAAQTLLLLNKIWKLNISNDKLMSIALTLGADVPACLYNKKAFIGKIGEEITACNIDISRYYVVLASCSVEISTNKVFNNYSSNFKNMIKINKNYDLDYLLENTTNDLLEPAIKIEPKIKSVIDLLNSQKDCVKASMSGSGSVCFAIFKNKKHATNCLENIKNNPLIKWVKISKIH